MICTLEVHLIVATQDTGDYSVPDWIVQAAFEIVSQDTKKGVRKRNKDMACMKLFHIRDFTIFYEQSGFQPLRKVGNTSMLIS